MEKQKHQPFVPDTCDHCGQTKNYDLALAKGHAKMLLAFYNAVREKDVNAVHINNEMVADRKQYRSLNEMIAAGKVPHTMAANVSTLNRHGLLKPASKEEAGVWLMTPKAADFLFRNASIPRVAIVDKREDSKEGYWNEQTDRVTFGDLMKKETPFWDFNEATLIKLKLAPRPLVDAAQAALL